MLRGSGARASTSARDRDGADGPPRRVDVRPTRDGTVTTNGASLARRRRCGERPGLVGDPADRLDSVLHPTAALGRVDEQDGTQQQANPGDERDRGSHRPVIGATETCPEGLGRAIEGGGGGKQQQLQLKSLTLRGRQEHHRHEGCAGPPKVVQDFDDAASLCTDVLEESGDRLTVREPKWLARRPVLVQHVGAEDRDEPIPGGADLEAALDGFLPRHTQVIGGGYTDTEIPRRLYVTSDGRVRHERTQPDRVRLAATDALAVRAAHDYDPHS